MGDCCDLHAFQGLAQDSHLCQAVCCLHGSIMHAIRCALYMAAMHRAAWGICFATACNAVPLHLRLTQSSSRYVLSGLWLRLVLMQAKTEDWTAAYSSSGAAGRAWWPP